MKEEGIGVQIAELLANLHVTGIDPTAVVEIAERMVQPQQRRAVVETLSQP